MQGISFITVGKFIQVQPTPNHYLAGNDLLEGQTQDLTAEYRFDAACRHVDSLRD